MDGHPGRPIVAGAWAGQDAGHWDDDPDHRAQFREPGRGFRWAWDEEVVADEVRLPERRSARLVAACLAAADAIEEAVLHRDVPQAVGREGASLDVLDAKVVVVRGAARREQLERQGQRDVRRLAPRARS
jgi:hypothetical protein